MLKYIGGLLFAIGVALLLPFDEIFILAPLIAIYGLSIVPVYYAIGLGCFIVGALILGIHIIPWFVKHPLGILTLSVAFIVLIYLTIVHGGVMV